VYRLIALFIIASLFVGKSFAVQQKDPTKPAGFLSTGHLGVNGLSLQGVVISKQKKVALINGQVVHEQDWLGDVQIVAINKQNVELKTKAGKVSKLPLHR